MVCKKKKATAHAVARSNSVPDAKNFDRRINKKNPIKIVRNENISNELRKETTPVNKRLNNITVTVCFGCTYFFPAILVMIPNISKFSTNDTRSSNTIKSFSILFSPSM